MIIQTITRKELQDIHNIACKDWKLILENKAKEDVFTDNIGFSKEEVNNMYEASTSEQLPLIKKLFKKPEDLLDRITSLDALWKELGLNPEDILPYKDNGNLTKKQLSSNAQTTIQYLSELLNQDSKFPDFNNKNQRKYYLWYEKNARGGWSLCGVGAYSACAHVGYGFYFKDEKTARHIDKYFKQVMMDYLPL